MVPEGQEERRLIASSEATSSCQPVDEGPRRTGRRPTSASAMAAHRAARQGPRIESRSSGPPWADEGPADQAVAADLAAVAAAVAARAANEPTGSEGVPGSPRSHSTAASRPRRRRAWRGRQTRARTRSIGIEARIPCDEDARQVGTSSRGAPRGRGAGAVDDHGVGALPQAEAGLQLIRREHLLLGRRSANRSGSRSRSLTRAFPAMHTILEHTEPQETHRPRSRRGIRTGRPDARTLIDADDERTAPRPSTHRRSAVLAGLAVGGSALGGAELLAGILPGAASPSSRSGTS